MKPLKRETLAKRLRVRYRKAKTWDKLAAELTQETDVRITGGMAYRIALSEYEPASPEIRRALGLQVYGIAPACTKCGDVHVSRRCSHSRKVRDLFDVPIGELRQMLENREEFK